jgi:hypothetical protein
MEREKIARNALLVIAVLLGIFLAVKMAPKIVLARNVSMTLVKNREPIASLTNARDPDFTWTTRLSRIEFPEGTELSHPDRGPLGYLNDFYLDLSTVMTVKKEGSYVFGVASDDGFGLWIDEKPIGEFISNRPFTTNLYTIYIKPGTYTYRLMYYQGFGRQGLLATWKPLEDTMTRVIGQGSSAIRFRAE